MRGPLVTCLLGAVALGSGCHHEGTYELTWEFGEAQSATPPGDGGVADAQADAAVDHGAGDAAAEAGPPDAALDGVSDAAASEVLPADAASPESGVPGPDGAPDGTADAGPDGDSAAFTTGALTLEDGGPTDAGDAPLAASVGCGAHGVFALRITGSTPDGKGEDVIVPCSTGRLVRAIAPGTWDFTVHALDARGHFKEQPVTSSILHTPVSGVVVAENQVTHVPPVLLIPQPACRDGVDNDRDGRVDSADPDCRSPEGASEAGGPDRGAP